jgi:hypothetical protein
MSEADCPPNDGYFSEEYVRSLLIEIEHLKQQVLFLTRHTTIAQGIKGETISASITNAIRQNYGSAFDLLAKNNIRIEVKFSKISQRSYLHHQKRWAWGKIFGQSGQKDFDFILLVGEKDMRFADVYRDSEGVFVIFCIPKIDITEKHIYASKGTAFIQLNTNPSDGKYRQYFRKYEMTVSEIERLFEF